MFSNMFGLPDKWHIENYINLFIRNNIARNILNSLFLAVTTVAVQLVLSLMVSFVLTHFRLKGSKLLTGSFIVGILIPMQVLMIPIAVMAKYVSGYNHYWFLILVYVATGIPYMIFVMSGFMKGIPKELVEASLIDGCSGFRVFSSIIVPLSKPVIATMGMLSFIGIWNELIMALILISKSSMQTVSLMLATFSGEFFSDFPGMCAAVVLCVVPTMAIYFVFQENIIGGMTAGAVKE